MSKCPKCKSKEIDTLQEEHNNIKVLACKDCGNVWDKKIKEK